MSKERWKNLFLFVGPVIAFLLGPGFLWNWGAAGRDSERLSLEKTKASIEIREKMNGLLAEIGKFQRDPSLRQKQPREFKAKIEYFNALEKSLAKLEGRPATIYDFEEGVPAAPAFIELKPVQPEKRQ